MKVVALAIVLLAASVLGQERAYWKFYSGADCGQSNQIGFLIEKVVRFL
jgi:hypothetical protein